MVLFHIYIYILFTGLKREAELQAATALVAQAEAQEAADAAAAFVAQAEAAAAQAAEQAQSTQKAVAAVVQAKEAAAVASQHQPTGIDKILVRKYGYTFVDGKA